MNGEKTGLPRQLTSIVRTGREISKGQRLPRRRQFRLNEGRDKGGLVGKGKPATSGNELALGENGHPAKGEKPRGTSQKNRARRHPHKRRRIEKGRQGDETLIRQLGERELGEELLLKRRTKVSILFVRPIVARGGREGYHLWGGGDRKRKKKKGREEIMTSEEISEDGGKKKAGYKNHGSTDDIGRGGEHVRTFKGKRKSAIKILLAEIRKGRGKGGVKLIYSVRA